jgi:hypothetical protein
MNNEIKTFITLKYQILTQNTETWYLSETYPKQAIINWAWRCAADVEYLARDRKSRECIRVAKLFRKGEATKEELTDRWQQTSDQPALAHFYIYYTENNYTCVDAVDFASASKENSGFVREDVWDQYIEWLIEELYKYECDRSI